MIRPDFSREQALEGPVCGIDEAGRGPLAGPVVAAAVILDSGRCPDGLNDSKVLSPMRRELLLGQIEASAHIGVGIADVAEIDQLNILQATLRAMARAVAALPVKPAAALVDGNRPPRLPCHTLTVVKGDRLSLSIAAASIVAKVTRDRIMAALAQEHPAYGWERNAGYGTAPHLAAIRSHGVTCHHRRHFAPVRAALAAAASPGSSLDLGQREN